MAPQTHDVIATEQLRVLSTQPSQAESMKIVATFATGLAGTIVVAALQTDGGVTLNRFATWCLLISALLTLALPFLDRLSRPSMDALSHNATKGNWDDEKFNIEFGIQLNYSVDHNRQVLRDLRNVLLFQLALAILAAACAVASLLNA